MAYFSQRISFPRPLLKLMLVLLMLLLLGTIMQVRKHASSAPEQLLVREVVVAKLTPPPAPPQAQHQDASNQHPKLLLSDSAAEVSLMITPMEVALPTLSGPVAPEPSALALPSFSLSQQETVAESIETFALEQLDQVPRLLSRISAKVPQSLAAKGVHELQLTLHVVIHENGSAEFKGLESQPLAELLQVAQQIAHQARFTAPMRGGVKVKAEFYWPVRIKA